MSLNAYYNVDRNLYIDGLVGETYNSSALALSCTNPLISSLLESLWTITKISEKN